MRRYITTLAVGLVGMAITGCATSQQTPPPSSSNNATSTASQTTSHANMTRTANTSNTINSQQSEPSSKNLPSSKQTSYRLSHFNPTSFTAVTFINPKVGYVAGKDSIYKTTDGGKTWTKVYTSQEPIVGIQAKYQPVGNEEYVVAYTKTYLIRSTDGQNFAIQGVGGNKDGGGNVNIESISLLDNNMIYLVDNGVVWASDGENGALYRATPTGTIASISAVDDSTCYAATETGVIYKTTDSGRHWSKVFTAPIKQHVPWKPDVHAEGHHVAVLFYGGDQGMSQTAYILYDSNDDGNTWQTMFDEPYFNPDYKGAKPLNKTVVGEHLESFTMDPKGDILVTDVDENNGNIVVLTTINPEGKTIVHDPVGPSANSPSPFDMRQILGISTPDGKKVYVAGGKSGKGVIEISSDGGLSWSS